MIDKYISIVSNLFFFLLPLYFLPFTNPNIEYDKQALLIFFSLLLFFLMLWKKFEKKEVKIVTTLFDLPFILLVLAYLASTVIVSPNKIDSLISPMATGTIIAAALLYFSLNQLLDDSKFLTLNSTFLILSSSLVSLVYIIQSLPPSFFFPVKLNLLLPLGSPLSAVTFLTPLAVYLAIRIALRFTKKDKDTVSFKLIKPVVLPFFAFLIIASTISILTFHLFTSQKPILLPFPFAWTIIMEIYKNFRSFIFGVGPANFLYAYSVAKPVAINLTPLWNVLLTSSSNLPATIAVEAGIIAVSIFIFIITKIFLMGAGVGRTRPYDNDNNISYPYLLSLISAIILQLLFPSSVALFALTVIFLSFAAPKKEIKIDFKLPSYYFLLPLGLTFLLGFIFLGKFYLADIFYRLSASSFNQQKIGSSFNFAQDAIKFNPSSDRYYLLSSVLSLSIARNLSSVPEASDSANQQNIAQLIQQSITHARSATLLNKQNPQNWAQLASVYQSLIGGVQGADQSALDALSQQMALDPASPFPKLTAAGVFSRVGELSASQALLIQTINLKPDWAQPHYSLATILIQSQQYKEAASELQKVLDLTPSESKDYKNVQMQLEQIKQLILKESTPSATPSANLKKSKPSPSPKSTNP